MGVGPVGLGKGGRSDGGADIRISLSIGLQYSDIERFSIPYLSILTSDIF